MHPALILLMTIATIVGGSAQLQCAVGKPEKINGIMKCPEPRLAHFHLKPITVPEAERRRSLATHQEIYPYHSKGVEARKIQNLPTCTKNSDCNWADTNEYRGICYPARNFWTTELIKVAKLCFAAKAFHQSEYYLDPDGVGLKSCEKSADCADSENMGG